jgi:hypothetical protein
MYAGQTAPSGALYVKKIERPPLYRKFTWKEVLYWSLPHSGLDPEVLAWRKANMPRMLNQLWRFYTMVGAAKISGYPFIHAKLFLEHLKGNGQSVVLGLASLRVVTTVGVNDIVDEFDEATDDASLKTFNFHGIGTGVTAEAVGDTALGTELTTEYNPDNTRATGTQSQPSANVYQTLATNTLDSGTPAVTEHGVLTQAATGGGTLLDRSVFSAKNLDGSAGDGLQSTYQLTISAGS